MKTRKNHLLNAIAKAAKPTTLAALIADLECCTTDEELEFDAANYALLTLQRVLEANVGEEQAAEMILNAYGVN